MHKIVRHPGITRLARTREYLEQRGSWEEQPEVKLQTVMWALASCADVFDSIGSLLGEAEAGKLGLNKWVTHDQICAVERPLKLCKYQIKARPG